MLTPQRIAAALAATLLLAAPLRGAEPPSKYKFETELGNKETSLATVPDRQGGVTGPMRPAEFMAVASNLQAGAMETLDSLIVTESHNSSEMEERWQQTCRALFHKAATFYDEVERLMAERKEDPARTQPFRDEMRKFMDDIEQNGHACMVWRRRTFTKKFDMEHAIDNYPSFVAAMRNEVKEAQDALLAGQALLSRTGLKVKDVEDQLEKIREACCMLQWSGSLAKERCSKIKEEFGDKTPELDRNVEKTMTDWKAVADRYPNLSRTLSPYPPKWAGKMKDQWDAFLRVRKDFDTTYAPLLEGKLFDDLSLFKGVAYGELNQVPDATKTKLIAKREALKRKTADQAAIQKALEDERRLSAEERPKWREYQDTWGPGPERDLRLLVANVDSASRERQISLIAARIKSPTLSALFSTAARAAVGTASDAIRNAWYKAKEQADAEYNTWWNARVQRRAKLGLKPGWDD